MLASTLLISPGPKPVTVLLCFGRVKLAGPTGPLKSAMGALVEGRRSRAGAAAVAMLTTSIAEKGELLREGQFGRGEGGVEGEADVAWTPRRDQAMGGRRGEGSKPWDSFPRAVELEHAGSSMHGWTGPCELEQGGVGAGLHAARGRLAATRPGMASNALVAC